MNKIFMIIFLKLLFLHSVVYGKELDTSLDANQIKNNLQDPLEPPIPSENLVTDQNSIDAQNFTFHEEKIFLKRIKLDGNTIFFDNELAKYFNAFIGKNISLAMLYGIAENIANHYRREGYVLATAFIPEQEIRNGIITVRIVEGYIDKINLEGDYEHNRIIDQTLEKINNIRPFNIKLFERYIILLNELPGINAKAILKKGSSQISKRGAVDLHIVFSKSSGKLSFGVNNNVSKPLGNFVAHVNTDANNFLINNSNLNLYAMGTDTIANLELIGFSEKLHLNAEGSSLLIEGSYIKARPINRFNQRIVSNSYNFSTTALHPFIRNREHNLVGFTGINFSNSRSTVEDILITKDAIRSVNLGISYDFFDKVGGANIFSSTYFQGIKFLNASKKNSIHLSNVNANPNFSKVFLKFSRLQYIYKDLNLYFSSIAQYTNDTLVASEKFTFGGANIGKGYDASIISGDRGFAFTTEVRNKIPKFLEVSGEVFGFYDYGAISNIGKKNTLFPKSAASLGTGLRFNIGTHSSAKIVIAQPTSKKVFQYHYNKSKKPTKIILGLYIRG